MDKAEVFAVSVDLKSLHAKIGQLALENDFLVGALGHIEEQILLAVLERRTGFPRGDDGAVIVLSSA